MNHLFQFFFGGKQKEEDELSQPIPVRVPQKLLTQIEAQAEEIGGSRYRSKHLLNLLHIGAKYFCARTDLLRSLPLESLELHMRIGYAFYELELNPNVVAEQWGHPNVNQWSKWLSGEETPSYEELERFAYENYLSPDWLKYGSENEYTMHQVFELPLKCYSNFYEFAKFIFNLRREKIQELRIIRNKLDGAVLIDVTYEQNKSITVDCHDLHLMNESVAGAIELYHLKEFVLFLALFQHNSNYPYTYSISDKYFKKIKSGETTFKRTHFFAADANEFNASEQWAHVLVDEQLVKTMDANRIWDGGKNLLTKLFNDSKNLSAKIQDIKARIKNADISENHFQECVELFVNFDEDFYSRRQHTVALNIPTYFDSKQNYLISGLGRSGFNLFAVKFAEYKIKANAGLIYINGTGVESDLKTLKDILADNDRANDLYDVNTQGMDGLHHAIQNKKVIYFAVVNPNDQAKAKEQLSGFVDVLRTVLSQKFYAVEEHPLTIFSNECVEFFDKSVRYLCEGGGGGLKINMVNTDRINVQAKSGDDKFENKEVYEILLGNTQNKIIYKPNTVAEAEMIQKDIEGIDKETLTDLEKNVFVLHNSEGVKLSRTDNAVFL